MSLENRFENYANMNKKDQSILYVLKGIPYHLYPGKNKLFSLPVDANIEEIEKYKSKRLQDLFDRIQKNSDWYWGTYEELNDFLPTVMNNFEIVLVDNNLYYNHYPFKNNVHNISGIIQLMENDSEKEQTDQEQKLVETIQNYYGSITNNILNDTYFVAYRELSINKEQVVLMNLYDSIQKDVEVKIESEPQEDEYEFEITFEEDAFLHFTDLILQNNLNYSSVRVMTTDDVKELPNNYSERLAILNGIIGDRTHLYFAPKEMSKRKIERLEEYKQVLKKYWGYDEFRDLRMYKNIDDRSKEFVSLSQAQIINDLVEQTEIALEEKNPRDIYITSSTGSGKSLMFQLPALYLAEKYPDINPLTIVISPLIGLMNDQVEGLENKSIDAARTIHSNMTIYEREKVIQEIQDGTVDIIYMSTETLQNRSDIKMLIGERKIGLFIVDEAHIVTTWGKSFRADYWYMGVYLQKLRKEHHFPIATFTATAIYGGIEDMYEETRDSLNMVNPIKYFGYIKRDNIEMRVDNLDNSGEYSYKTANHEYIVAKYKILERRLEGFISKNQKTLIYFPTVRLLNGFYNYLRSNNSELLDLTGRYFGPLEKEEKNAAYESFKSGIKPFILATKAFGMGIDIPDIANVYHFAPTGNVIDYIQEIGRAARDLPKGRAYFDFLQADFSYVKRLHGMNRISVPQIVEVMRKIKELYIEKGSRNLTVSADDFQYIVQNNEEDDVDNKIKIILLMIEKDFEKKNGYSPFVARPKQLFGNELVFMNDEKFQLFKRGGLGPYLNKVEDLSESQYTAVYELKLKDLWEKEYKKYSFPQFKFYVFSKNTEEKLKHTHLFKELVFATGVSVESSLPPNQVKSQFGTYLDAFEEFLRGYVVSEKYFDEDILGEYFNKRFKLNDIFKAKGIATSFINTMLQFQSFSSSKILKERVRTRTNSYTPNPHYMSFFEEIKASYNNVFNLRLNTGINGEEGYRFYRFRKTSNKSGSKPADRFERELLVLGLLETTGLLTYDIVSGNNPQIYIRINSVSSIESVLNNSSRYRNSLLDDVNRKHKISVEMMTFLFKLPKHGNSNKEKIQNYTKDFWNYIEDYFLGVIPSEVSEKLYR